MYIKLSVMCCISFLALQFIKEHYFSLCITGFAQCNDSRISRYIINHINQRSIINSVITFAEENN